MGAYRNHSHRSEYGGGRRNGWVKSVRNGDRRRSESRQRRRDGPRDGRSNHGGRRHSDRYSRSRSRRGGKSAGAAPWKPYHRNGQEPPRRERQRGGQHQQRGRSSSRPASKGRGGGRRGNGRAAEPSPASSDEYSSSSSSGSDDDAAKEKKKKKGDDSDKDEIVHYSWQRNSVLAGKYRLIKLLGDGTFGRVLLAKDQYDNREVAIKVIRDVKRYGENARIEADILKDIRKIDPRGEASRSAIMWETFEHGRHFCLVFEPCGASLYDFLKKNSFRGFWLQDIQTFASQSLAALAFLHERLRMTHTDLKPENILLESMEPARQVDFPREATWKPSAKRRSTSSYVRPATPAIRLIDFGNATYEDEHHSSIINTRQYRGPEVILSLGWNERSDVWSMGCILMELYTGELLFGTHENLEHLALMERILEPIPSSMLAAVPKGTREKFVSMSSRQPRLLWPEGAQGASSERHVRSQRQLADMMAYQQHLSFTSFVGHCLTIDPAKRPSASEASRHSFLSKHFSD